MALKARHPNVRILCLAEFISPGIRPDIVWGKSRKPAPESISWLAI
jgi:hypothetical protein